MKGKIWHNATLVVMSAPHNNGTAIAGGNTASVSFVLHGEFYGRLFVKKKKKLAKISAATKFYFEISLY